MNNKILVYGVIFNENHTCSQTLKNYLKLNNKISNILVKFSVINNKLNYIFLNINKKCISYGLFINI